MSESTSASVEALALDLSSQHVFEPRRPGWWKPPTGNVRLITPALVPIMRTPTRNAVTELPTKEGRCCVEDSNSLRSRESKTGDEERDERSPEVPITSATSTTSTASVATAEASQSSSEQSRQLLPYIESSVYAPTGELKRDGNCRDSDRNTEDRDVTVAGDSVESTPAKRSRTSLRSSPSDSQLTSSGFLVLQFSDMRNIEQYFWASGEMRRAMESVTSGMR